jgi:hypothetical protein
MPEVFRFSSEMPSAYTAMSLGTCRARWFRGSTPPAQTSALQGLLSPRTDPSFCPAAFHHPFLTRASASVEAGPCSGRLAEPVTRFQVDLVELGLGAAHFGLPVVAPGNHRR